MIRKQWMAARQIVDTKNPTPFEIAVAAEQWNDILVAINELPRPSRVVVQLLHGIGDQKGITYSHEQVGRVMKTHPFKVGLFQQFAYERLSSMPILQKHVKTDLSPIVLTKSK